MYRINESRRESRTRESEPLDNTTTGTNEPESSIPFTNYSTKLSDIKQEIDEDFKDKYFI